MLARYTVYHKVHYKKRASGCGIYTDDLERAKQIAENIQKSNKHGLYDWIKVRDNENGKYIYEA